MKERVKNLEFIKIADSIVKNPRFIEYSCPEHSTKVKFYIESFPEYNKLEVSIKCPLCESSKVITIEGEKIES